MSYILNLLTSLYVLRLINIEGGWITAKIIIWIIIILVLGFFLVPSKKEESQMSVYERYLLRRQPSELMASINSIFILFDYRLVFTDIKHMLIAGGINV